MDVLTEVNFNLLCDLVNALKSKKLAVESLSRQDAFFVISRCNYRVYNE